MNASLKVVDGGIKSGELSSQERIIRLEQEYKDILQLLIGHLHALFPNLKKSNSSYFRMIENGMVCAVYGAMHIRFPVDIKLEEVSIPVESMGSWEITLSNSPCQSVANILSSKNKHERTIGQSVHTISLKRKSIKIGENDE
ncbi:MAG: hypothetical protein PHY14_00540 [Candidatus Gracilibacteria bacterium]|nr:hypothetical protein [Candidatus Gracilibacteria bacterium]